MHPFPHHYHVQSNASGSGPVVVTTQDAPALETHAPPEFDGPAGYWSPETMLVGSIANCYILSFRAVARASKLEWSDLAVAVEGVLDRVDGVTRFVRYVVKAQLTIASADRRTLAATVMEKAKRTCLVTNSLSGECELEPSIVVAEAAPAA